MNKYSSLFTSLFSSLNYSMFFFSSLIYILFSGIAFVFFRIQYYITFFSFHSINTQFVESLLNPNGLSKITEAIISNINNDAPEAWQIGFQDNASPGITGIVELHNDIFYFLIIISLAVF
jgi:Cytochrome C oxidase subunit II, transmembrane domain